MPTKTKDPQTTMTDLERQAATDGELLEDLPEFPSPQEFSDAEEDCPAVGANGRRCQLKVHSGIHRWSPRERTNGHTPMSTSALSDTEPIVKTEQPALPGTPEPEQDDFSIPYESQFNGADYQGSPGIKSIAERLIAETEEFEHLIGIEIRYFWKRRGGLKGGNPRLGNLQRPTGLAAYGLGRPVFALTLAADHCLALKLDQQQITALIFHQLCKASADPDDHSAFRVVGPDCELFALELQRFGPWSADLKETAATFRQLQFDESAVASSDGESDPEEVE